MTENDSTPTPHAPVRTPVAELVDHGLGPDDAVALQHDFASVETLAASLSRHEARACDLPEYGTCPWHESRPLHSLLDAATHAINAWEQVGWKDAGLALAPSSDIADDTGRAAAEKAFNALGTHYDRKGRPISGWEFTKLKTDPSYSRIDCTRMVDAESPHLDLVISTSWLGWNENHLRVGAPIIFETMLFGQNPITNASPLANYGQRYRTEEEAIAGHQEMINGLSELMGAPRIIPLPGWPRLRVKRRKTKPMRGMNQASRALHARVRQWCDESGDAATATFRSRGRFGRPDAWGTLLWDPDFATLVIQRDTDPALTPIPGGTRYRRRIKARSRR